MDRLSVNQSLIKLKTLRRPCHINVCGRFDANVVQISKFVYELSEVLVEMLVPLLCSKFPIDYNKRGLIKSTEI